MLTIRARVRAAQAAIGRASAHLAAADAHAAAGDSCETEHQLRMAVSALDIARDLVERAAIRAALPRASSSEGGVA